MTNSRSRVRIPGSRSSPSKIGPREQNTRGRWIGTGRHLGAGSRQQASAVTQLVNKTEVSTAITVEANRQLELVRQLLCCNVSVVDQKLLGPGTCTLNCSSGDWSLMVRSTVKKGSKVMKLSSSSSMERNNYDNRHGWRVIIMMQYV